MQTRPVFDSGIPSKNDFLVTWKVLPWGCLTGTPHLWQSLPHWTVHLGTRELMFLNTSSVPGAFRTLSLNLMVSSVSPISKMRKLWLRRLFNLPKSSANKQQIYSTFWLETYLVFSHDTSPKLSLRSRIPFEWPIKTCLFSQAFPAFYSPDLLRISWNKLSFT